MSVNFDTYCGLSCENCEYKTTHDCGGCITTQGNPFHGKCEVAECAKSRGKRFCGECEDIPCDTLNRYAFDVEHGDGGARIHNCQSIKAKLVAEAREGVNAISYCGHHCDHCFLGQWCGGCRSDYNCCSFAGAYEDYQCPNVKCAKEKHLVGCYACDVLRDCNKGYYGKENEYVAKATAMFIKKYGENSYAKALKSAIESGLCYPTAFDETGSVEGAIALLEKYI